MTNAKRLAGAATIALAATGCTTSLSTRADLTRTIDRGVAMPGLVYHLPMLQFEVSVKRTLSRCPAADDGTDDSIDALLKDPDPEIGFATLVTAKPSYVRGESYVVDYSSLTAGTKTTSFALEPYATTGNLKSVNVSAEDHSAEIIRDVAKVALVGASFATAGPGAAALAANLAAPGPAFVAQRANEPPEQSLASDDVTKVEMQIRSHLVTITAIDCNTRAREQLAAAAVATAALEAGQEELDGASRRVADAAVLVGIRGVGEAYKQQFASGLEAALKELSAKIATLEKAKIEKSDAERALSLEQTSTFPTRFDVADQVLEATTAAITYEDELSVRTRRVVDADGLAQSLAELRKTIGPKRYAAAIAHRKVLENYLTEDGIPKSFKRNIATLIRESRSDQAKTRLLDQLGTDVCDPGVPDLGKPAPKFAECMIKKLTVTVALRSAEREPADASPEFPTLDSRKRLAIAPPGSMDEARLELVAARNGKSHAGLFIRPPIRGELIVCEKSACVAGDKNLFVGDPDDPPIWAPQLGQLRFLPFRNRIFAYNEMLVQLEPDGSLTRFEYKSKKAVAAEFAATAADVASQIDAARTKARTEAKDSRTAKIEELQYEIDSIAKTKARAEATAFQPLDAVKTETVALDAQSALANAKLARLKAEAALIAYSQSGGN